jgi:ribose/xylose/arabinose/galactoside ABC-type transport system permease subunit
MNSRTAKILTTTGVPIAIVLVLAVILFQILSPVFLEPSAMKDYITNAIPILLITVGVAIVITAGGIDLSVGTVAGLSAGTSLWALHSGAPTLVGILVGVATGTIFGVINGLLVTRLGINDFIVTLATLNIAAGLLIVLTEKVSLAGVRDSTFSNLVYGSILGIPTSFWIAAILFVLAQFVLARTILGRRIFAVGVSPEAASNAGVSVSSVRLWTFVISGLLAGVAGVLLASRLGTVQAFLGVGYEFTAIAGAVLGGVSLAGGRGSVWAALVGGLLLATLQQGLRLNGVDPVYFSIVTGVCIVVGVVFDRGVQRLVFNRLLGRAPTSPPPGDSSDPPTVAPTVGSRAAA